MADILPPSPFHGSQPHAPLPTSSERWREEHIHAARTRRPPFHLRVVLHITLVAPEVGPRQLDGIQRSIPVPVYASVAFDEKVSFTPEPGRKLVWVPCVAKAAVERQRLEVGSACEQDEGTTSVGPSRDSQLTKTPLVGCSDGGEEVLHDVVILEAECLAV